MNVISLANKFLAGHDEDNNFIQELHKYSSFEEIAKDHPELNYTEESTFEVVQFIRDYYYE